MWWRRCATGSPGVCGTDVSQYKLPLRGAPVALIPNRDTLIVAGADDPAALHAADHGYKTIGDIMRSLNPLEGAIIATQRARACEPRIW